MPNDTLIKALISAKAEFKPIKKDGLNPHFHSKFASLDSIIDSTEEALRKNGLVLCQPVVMVEGSPMLRTALFHESGELVIDSFYPLVPNGNPQLFCQQISYARRYGYTSLFGIVADEDNDGESYVRPSEAKRSPGRPARKAPTEPHQGSPEEVIPPPTEDNGSVQPVAPRKAIVGPVQEQARTKEDMLARFKAQVAKEFGSFDLSGKDPFSRAAIMMIRETFQVSIWNDVLVGLNADSVRYRIRERYEQALARTKAAYSEELKKDTEALPF